MIQYRFIFDSETPTAKIGGWEELTLKASFDDAFFRVDAEGELIIHDEAIHNYIAARNICEKISLQIQYRSTNTPSWTTLKTVLVPVIQIEKDCEINAYKINFEGQSILDLISRGATEKIKIDLNTHGGGIVLKQPWSGGTLEPISPEINAVNIGEAIELIIQSFKSSASISGNLIGTAAPLYNQGKWLISSLPAVVSGDVIDVLIVTPFGDRYELEITAPVAGYTGTQLAEKIAQGLLFISPSAANTTLSMGLNELCGRLSDAIETADEVEIISDFAISSISITNNGGAIGTVAQTQGFEYSLKNLYVGKFGSRAILNLSFDDVVNILNTFIPTVIEDDDTTINISPYNDLNTKAPVTTFSNRFANTAHNTVYAKERLRVTHDHELENYTDTVAAWVWSGSKLDISSSITAAGLFTWSYTYTGATQPHRISGYVTLQNTSTTVFRTAVIQVDVNGTILGESLSFILLPGGTQEVTGWGAVGEFCLTSGDIVTFTVIASQGTQSKTAASPHSLFLEGALCFEGPQVREDRQEEDQSKLIEFLNCGDQQTVSLSSQYYAGLGFLWSQIWQELADVDEKLIHLVLVDPDTDEAELFSKNFYFDPLDANVCSCYQDDKIPFYFPNLLLQPRYMAFNFRALPPSGMRVSNFVYATEIDATGAFSQTVTESEADIFPRHTRLNRATFRDTMTPEKFLSLVGDKVADVDLCDVQGNGVLKEFSLTLGSGTTEILIEA